MGRLDGKVTVITGTGSGIGRAAALRFAEQGARVVGCDLDEHSSLETVRLVKAQGGEMASLEPLDLGEEANVSELMSFAQETYGGFDVVYNNAAKAGFAFVRDMTPETWHFTIRNELDLVYYSCHHAWRHLVDRGGGSIINMASTAGMIGIRGLPTFAHAAAKGAVIALTKQLAAEGAEFGVRANSISPGSVETSTTAELMKDPAFVEAMMETHMIKRFGQPEDVSHFALYLASDESSWVTGGNFVIDGGLTAW